MTIKKLFIYSILTCFFMGCSHDNHLSTEVDSKKAAAIEAAQSILFNTNAIENGDPQLIDSRASYNETDDIWTVSGTIQWKTPAQGPARAFWALDTRVDSTFIVKMKQIGNSDKWKKEYLEIDNDIVGDGKNFF